MAYSVAALPSPYHLRVERVEAIRATDVDIDKLTDASRPIAETPVAASDSKILAMTMRVSQEEGLINLVNSTETDPELETMQSSALFEDLSDPKVKHTKEKLRNSKIGSDKPFSSVTEKETTLPSQDQLFKLSKTVPQLQKDTLASGIEPGSHDRTENQSSSNNHVTDTVHKLNLNTQEARLVNFLMICIPAVGIILSLLLISLYIVYEKSTVKRTETSGINRHQTPSDGDNNDNMFMGIPANIQIWKDLQKLPPSVSLSELPDSKK